MTVITLNIQLSDRYIGVIYKHAAIYILILHGGRMKSKSEAVFRIQTRQNERERGYFELVQWVIQYLLTALWGWKKCVRACWFENLPHQLDIEPYGSNACQILGGCVSLLNLARYVKIVHSVVQCPKTTSWNERKCVFFLTEVGRGRLFENLPARSTVSQPVWRSGRATRDREVPGSKLACAIWFFP